MFQSIRLGGSIALGASVWLPVAALGAIVVSIGVFEYLRRKP